MRVSDWSFRNRRFSRPAKWVLAVPYDSGIHTIEELKGKKIATELTGFTQRYFAEREIDVAVEFSWGATEAKVVSGLADAIVEVTETGSTIRAHGLKIIHELMETNTQLIANRDAYQDDNGHWEWKPILWKNQRGMATSISPMFSLMTLD